jgi:hypothetical protein
MLLDLSFCSMWNGHKYVAFELLFKKLWIFKFFWTKCGPNQVYQSLLGNNRIQFRALLLLCSERPNQLQFRWLIHILVCLSRACEMDIKKVGFRVRLKKLWIIEYLVEVSLRPQNRIWIFRAPRGIIYNTFKVKIFFIVHNYFLILLIVPIVIAVGEWKEHGFVV